MKICESDLPTSDFVLEQPCDYCHRQYIRRSSVVDFKNHPLVITVVYEHCLRPLGFALGRHVYSVTLLPGEEIELEFFRSARRSDELSREYSTEEVYSSEFSATVRDEWSSKETSNFKIGGGVSGGLNLGIFSISGHVEPSYAHSTESFHKAFTEFATKTSAKVDRKFDVHIDLKTEEAEGTRSTRRIRNLNQCQTVTYHYFQIARRYEATLKVIDVRFDTAMPNELPPLYTNAIRGLAVDYAIEPPVSHELLGRGIGTGQAAAAKGTSIGATRALALEAHRLPPEGGVLAATLEHPAVGSEELRSARELDLEMVVKMLGHTKEKERADLKSQVKRLLDRLGLKAGTIVAQHELCLSTSSLYADAVTGVCAACDTNTVETRRLEREKLELEIRRQRLALGSAYQVFGSVRGPEGNVGDVTVALRGSGGNTVAEAVSDNLGFYGLNAGDALEEGESYTVRATSFPPPFTGASEPPPFTWTGRTVEVELTLT